MSNNALPTSWNKEFMDFMEIKFVQFFIDLVVVILVSYNNITVLFVLCIVGNNARHTCSVSDSSLFPSLYTVHLMTRDWTSMTWCMYACSLWYEQPAVSSLRHRSVPRHPEGLGRASGERDVSEGGERISSARERPQHTQHGHRSVRDRLLHQQVWIRHRVLQWVSLWSVDWQRTVTAHEGLIDC